MKKMALALLVTCLASICHAADKATSLEQAAQACHIANEDNLNALNNCLLNASKLIRKATANHLNHIGQRDRVHLLNTKALELALQKNKCSSLGVLDVIKTDCAVQVELSLLRYMEARYATN